MTADDILRMLPIQRGHFAYESGHHAAMWIDLERLSLEPRPVEAMAIRLAEALTRYEIDLICGPLVEGAFVALWVATRLGARFVYTERTRESDGLYPYRYRLPRVLREEVRGRRVAIVNDVISAGSAVGKSANDLDDCGAEVVAIGALLILGDWTARFAAERGIGVEALATMENPIWTPAACPMCANGEPLTCHNPPP